MNIYFGRKKMFNSYINQLPEDPFTKLNHLLQGIKPPLSPLIMSLGEPQHKPPKIITDMMIKHRSLWHKYPPSCGSIELRCAVKKWLDRRYNLHESMIHFDKNILIVAGIREALYLIGTTIISHPENQDTQKSKVFIPNPFYQVYFASGILNNAEIILLNATSENNFLPNLEKINTEDLDNCSLFFLCSPSNPHGMILSYDYLQHIIMLAQKHNFVLVIDECYTDIYDSKTPIGALEICNKQNQNLKNVIVMQSLSKRSNAPGLRSGFVAGDDNIIEKFKYLRRYCAASVPLPIMAASTALWNDDLHVIENRNLYQQKINIAEMIFKKKYEFYRPPAGFFLWLKVYDDEIISKIIWQKTGVKVLPGRYLSIQDTKGHNPGKNFIRIALVHDLETTYKGLIRIVSVLENKNI